MDQFERQKQLTKAMNARMVLMIGGLMLAFTAVTSTAMYGANMFMIAAEALKENSEYLEALEQIGMSIQMARVIGAAFVVVAIVECFAGITALRFSNRVDKAGLVLKVVIVLLAVEVVMEVFLFLQQMTNIGRLFTAIAYPLFVLWGAWRMRSFAKKDPKRIYAVEPRKIEQKKRAEQQPKKSLKERAMVPQTDAAEEDVSEPEVQETAEEVINEMPEAGDDTETAPKSEEKTEE